jgi:hypothetical protein
MRWGRGLDCIVSPFNILLISPGQAGNDHWLAVFAPVDQWANFFRNAADSFKVAG